MSVAPIDLFASCIHLRRDGRADTGPSASGTLPGDWRLTAYHAKTDADVHAGHWEAHPGAETIVSCLIGTIRLHLRRERPGRPEEVIRLTAGTAAIVPRGRWYRVELVVPSTIMAVALPGGGRREPWDDD